MWVDAKVVKRASVFSRYHKRRRFMPTIWKYLRPTPHVRLVSHIASCFVPKNQQVHVYSEQKSCAPFLGTIRVPSSKLQTHLVAHMLWKHAAQEDRREQLLCGSSACLIMASRRSPSGGRVRTIAADAVWWQRCPGRRGQGAGRPAGASSMPAARPAARCGAPSAVATGCARTAPASAPPCPCPAHHHDVSRLLRTLPDRSLQCPSLGATPALCSSQGKLAGGLAFQLSNKREC